MKVHTTTEQGSDGQLAESKRRSPLTNLLLLLITFALGGCLALLLVNRMLVNQSEIYVSLDQMSDAFVVLDIMDDILPLFMLCGSLILLLVLLFAVVWAWTRTESPVLRYGSLLLLVILLILLAGLWFGGFSREAIPFPAI